MIGNESSFFTFIYLFFKIMRPNRLFNKKGRLHIKPIPAIYTYEVFERLSPPNSRCIDLESLIVRFYSQKSYDV